MRTCLLFAPAIGFLLLGTPAKADTVLDFQTALASRGSDVPFFDPLSISGFTLTATDPLTQQPSGLELHDSTSIFYAGEVGVEALAPASGSPDNVIQLTNDANEPFTLFSIDLARNFAFDPAPTVTFTGVQVGGGTVSQTFTVTTPLGVAAFQTFDFQGFTNLLSVSWGQPEIADGDHQFADIHVQATPTAVPEPGTWVPMLSIAAAMGWGAVRKRSRCV